MTAASEMLVERRRARQRLTFWRAVAVGAGLLALLILVTQMGGGKGSVGRNHIARVDISGMILDDAKQQKLLKDLKESDRVKAVVLRINSPGGTTTGGEALYGRIRELSEKKPVVAVFGTVAASAAYMAGIASDRIVTRGSTITGSVGVIVQWPNVNDLMGKLGVSWKELKSGKLKATPSPFTKDSEENLGPMKELVEDTFKWFVGLVAKRRKIKPEDIPGLTEGRVYSGRQAVKLGLADEIGGEDEAVAWLVKEKKIDKDLPVLERKPDVDNPFSSLTAMTRAALSRLGLGGLFPSMSTSSGLMSVQAGPSHLLSRLRSSALPVR